jgi:hypothetical protein
MYAAIRQYRSGDSAELARRVREEFLPVVSGIPGFRAYYVIDDGAGGIASISLCDDRVGAEETTRRAADWVRESVSELIDGPPEVTAGEVTAQQTA